MGTRQTLQKHKVRTKAVDKRGKSREGHHVHEVRVGQRDSAGLGRGEHEQSDGEVKKKSREGKYAHIESVPKIERTQPRGEEKNKMRYTEFCSS